MKGISMEEKQEIKKERKKIMQEIIGNYKVYKHADVMKIFEKEYGMVVSQASVSRYIDDLGIEKDSKGKYVLGQKVALNKEANNLLRILKSADGAIVIGDWESLMLKMKPTYVEAVAEQIEQLFEIENIDIHIFPGFNGSMLIYFDKEDAKRVKSILKKVVSYYLED